MNHDTTAMLAHKVEQYAQDNDHILNTRNVIEILKELDYTIIDNAKFVYVEKNGIQSDTQAMVDALNKKEAV